MLVLGICLLVGLIALLVFCLRSCGNSGSSTPEEKEPDAAASSSQGITPQSDAPDYSSLYSHKVTPLSSAAAYIKENDSFVKAGTFETDAVLDAGSAQEGNFLPVEGTVFYIDGSEVQLSDRWYRNTTNLIPYTEDVITADSYRIQDVNGNVIASIDHSDRYPVYVKPGEDARYGVLFMNAIAYIDASEIKGEEASDRGAPGELAQEMPVLMYHFFYSEADGGSRTDGNYVEVNELDEQLSYIKENGFTACTMREVQYWMEGRAQLPYHSIAITIDDADPSVHQYAMPVFTKYGLAATNFVICGWQPPEMPYELWEMRENGMELQSHGFLTHTGGCSGMGHGGILLCMNHDEGVEDTRRSFDYVDGGFVYCYPFGDINENAESIVRDGGAKLAFTTEGGRIHPGMDPLALPRVRVTGGNGINAFAASIG